MNKVYSEKQYANLIKWKRRFNDFVTIVIIGLPFFIVGLFLGILAMW